MDALFQQHEAKYHPTASCAPPENALRGSKLGIFKLVLQVVSIVSSIASIALSATVATGEVSQSVLIWIVPESAVAVIWGFSEVFTLYLHRWQCGIHIGAHVALNLLLWLGFTVGLGLTGLTLKQDLTYNRTFYDWTEKAAFYYQPDFLARLEATIFFLSILDLLHFVLFVLSCVEISKRNTAKSAPVTVASNNTFYDTTPIRPMYPQEPRNYYTATPPRVVTPPYIRSHHSSPQPTRQHVQMPVKQDTYVQHSTRQATNQTSQYTIIQPPTQPQPYFPSQQQSYFPSQRSYQAYQPHQMYEPQHYKEPIQQQAQPTELPAHMESRMEDIPVSPVSDDGYQLGYNQPWDMQSHPFSKEYKPY
ncbi:hypothetical protein F5Y18DRAFT_250225 [Xylariaceae sp. FL1019]|nr:hypothetical protein F5Y18DRAFT_250225 [Xylariaceae sp. FL1019]